jgi:hypothetical protein
VVVPLLTEVVRVIHQACVPFQQPTADQSFGTKKDSLEMLLRRKLNVVTTHALYAEIASLAQCGLLASSAVSIDELAKGEDVTPVDIDRITRQRADAIKRALNRALGPNLYYSTDALALALGELAPDLEVHLLTSAYWTAEFPEEEPEEDCEYWWRLEVTEGVTPDRSK